MFIFGKNNFKMKKIILALSFLFSIGAFAQAYTGKGDTKLQIGALIQDGGTGIVATNDYGIGENMSFGFVASYMLGAEEAPVVGKPEFLDRFDAKVRFNANLGSVFNFGDEIDIYPGLHLGTRNFGGHLGARYFFTDGFGVYSEASFPFAKYDTKDKVYGDYNNQFVFNIGMSFNL
jgi:hypothetical protein